MLQDDKSLTEPEATKADPRTRQPEDPVRGKRLLCFTLVSILLANVGQWLFFRLLGVGNPGTIRHELSAFLHVHTWTDSWLPMMQSVNYFQAHPDLPIYSAPLYDTLIYSLASLLPLWLLKHFGVDDAAMLRLLALMSWLAVAGVAAVSLRLGRYLLAQRNLRLDWASVAGVMVSVLFCYPLLKGYALGNAQTFLSFGFTVLLMLWTTQHERASGLTAALLTFVKPQYALLLVWMLVRRKWNAAAAFLATAVLLTGMSTLVFGWQNNLDYLHVLAGLSHKAQSHFANQSMFGTLNRMIGNGENLGYTPLVYTPYVRWVYLTTVATALLLVGGVLLFPWGKLLGSTGDLAAMGLVSVAASPMAWEHHYGIVPGVLAWIWFAYGCRQAKRPWLLALGAFLTLNALLGFNKLAPFHGWNVLQSYMYLGALLLVAVLMRMALAVTLGRYDPVP
ncbi:MAG: glycosyltransferase family 87 protein [Janthinobacterium lividum]